MRQITDGRRTGATLRRSHVTNRDAVVGQGLRRYPHGHGRISPGGRGRGADSDCRRTVGDGQLAQCHRVGAGSSGLLANRSRIVAGRCAVRANGNSTTARSLRVHTYGNGVFTGRSGFGAQSQALIAGCHSRIAHGNGVDVGGFRRLANGNTALPTGGRTNARGQRINAGRTVVGIVAAMRAVIVHAVIVGLTSLELGNVDRVGVLGARGNAHNLAGNVVVHITHAHGGHGTLPGRARIGRCRSRQRVVADHILSDVGH
ncbi:hypothetical protein D9M68_699420 [compost metagenome]